MAREELFRVTNTYDTVEPEKKALSFQSMELDSEPVRGTEIGVTATVVPNETNTFYVTFYIDGEEVHDMGDLPLEEGAGMPISAQSVPIPDAPEFDLTVAGGIEG